MTTTIAIVGLSFSGLACYSSLLSKLPKQQKCVILLIDKKEYFEFTPSILSAFFSPKSHNALSFPYSQTIGNSYIQGQLIKLTSNSLTIIKKDANEEEFLFDFCVLSFGGSYPFYIRPENERTLDERRDALLKAYSLIIEAKNIMIIGSGPTALEMAGYIKNKTKTPNVTVVVTGTELLKGFPKKAGKRVLDILVKKGVIFLFETEIKMENGEIQDLGLKKKYDLIIPCVGNRCHATKMLNNDQTFKDFIDTNRDRIIVNEFRQLQSKSQPTTVISNIFACGDVAISYDNYRKNLNEPDVVMKAEKSAEVAAENITRILKNKKNDSKKEQLRKMGSTFDGYVVDLGSKWDCVFIWKGLVMVGLMAWLSKQMIEKCGMKKMLGYRVFIWMFMVLHFVMNEVFTVCERRKY